MNYKNIFLIMVSLLMLVGISGFVEAIDGVNASISNIRPDTPTKTALNTFTNVYHLNNGTYTINITIHNLNNTNNVTGINISLDSAFTWGYGNWSGGVNTTQFINVSNSLLRWNRTTKPYVLGGPNISFANFTSFVFNVTVSQAGSLDGQYNFTIWAEYDGGKSSSSINIDSNITIDNTAPVLASAVTDDRTTINITFTETNGILGSSIGVGDFNVSTKNYSNLVVGDVSTLIAGNKTINITTTVFSRNETPFVGILSVNITDYAGNNISIATVSASDRIYPSLLSVGLTYNYSTRNLTLIFDEPIGTNIDVSGINLYDNVTSGNIRNSSLALSDDDTSYSVYAGSMNKTVIQLSEAFRDVILGWQPTAIGLNISITTATFNDSSGNIVGAVGNRTLNSYVIDTTDPALLIATYNHSSRVLNLTFSETIDSSTVNMSQLFIGNQANLTFSNVTRQAVLNGTVTTSVNSSSVIVTLTERVASNISGWRVSTLYLYTNFSRTASGKTVTDLVGRNMTTIKNDTARGYINSSTYTADTAVPGIRIAIVLNDTTPTKAGNVTFVITFNERMDVSTVLSVALDPNETATNYALAPGTWNNYTQWTGSYIINDNWFSAVGDGLTAISVSGGVDLANNAMPTNTSNEFIIDTTLPTLSMVWYNDTDFDYNESTGTESTSITNYLILKFSENVSVVSSTDANETTNIYLANETGTSYRFYGNETAGGGAIFVRDGTDRKKVNVAINNTMILWVRGKYGGYAKSHGIIVQNGSTLITDEAGNPMSNSTGVKDIYDHALTLTANGSGGISWTGFSVPHDVDSTPTWTELDKYISVVYTHTGTGWVQATSASNDFIPLRGYLMKITGATENKTIDIPLQTDTLGPVNPDNMALFTTSVSIDDGAYSLIGVNGYLDNLATDQNAASVGFLTSIGGADANNAVGSIVYADEVSTDIGTPGAMTANKLVPYRAYWIWANTKADSATYSFSGYAQSTKYPI